MRLWERIQLVGSGDGGFGLTDPFDCHVYAVDGGGEPALIDAGIGAATQDVSATPRPGNPARAHPPSAADPRPPRPCRRLGVAARCCPTCRPHSISLSRGQWHVDRVNRLFAQGLVPRSVV
jgi:hypothetical protein